MKILFLLLISLLLPFSNHAQVTIGSALSPESGTLLDLKEKSGEGANSTRGLILPRVGLEEIDELAPCVANPLPLDKINHTGLIVYNVTENPSKLLCKGLYVWLGSNWARLNGECERAPIPDEISISNLNNSYVMDGSEYTFKVTSNAKWTATITDTQNILSSPTSSFTGEAGDTDVKFTLKMDGSADKSASITFTSAAGETAVAQINGKKLVFKYNLMSDIIPDPIGQTVATLQIVTNSPKINPTVSFSPTSGDMTNWASVVLENKITNGDGTISYPITISVSENIIANRIGKITAKTGNGAPNVAIDVNVNQPKLTLSVDVPTWTSAVDGGSKVVTVTTNSTLGVPTIDPIVSDWLTATALVSNKTTLTTKVNTGAERIEVVKVKLGSLSATTTVTQEVFEFSLSQNSWIADPYGIATNNKAITVNTTSAKEIEVSSSDAWVTVVKNNKIITLTVPTTNAAVAPSRTATITVKIGTESKTIAVSQPQLTLSVDVPTWTSPVDGGSKVVTVNTNSTLGVPNIDIDPVSANWLTATALASKITTLKTTANIGDERTAKAIAKLGGLSAATTVTQTALDFTISEESWVADPYGIAANTRTFTVTTNSTKTIGFGSTAIPWITQSIAGKVITLSVPTSNVGDLRSANVIVKLGADNVTKSIAVSQPKLTLAIGGAATWVADVDDDVKAVPITTNSKLAKPTIKTNHGGYITLGAVTGSAGSFSSNMTTIGNRGNARPDGGILTAEIAGIPAVTATKPITQPLLTMTLSREMMHVDPLSETLVVTVVTTNSKTRKPVLEMMAGAGYFTVAVGTGTNNGATMSYPMNLTTTDHIVMDAQESAREFRASVNIPESDLKNSFGAVQEKLYISESTPEPLYFARGEAATKTLTFRSNSSKLYVDYNYKRMDESWSAWGNYNFPIDGWSYTVKPHPTVEGAYIYTCSITANGMGTIGGSQEGSVQVKVRENVTPIWNKNARYFLVRRYY